MLVHLKNKLFFQSINAELKLISIDEQIEVIHGTFYKNWIKIKSEGLSRINRNHIHFSTGLPSDKTVISGVRHNAELFIFINWRVAMSEGLKFYRSVNNVILSPGDENGFIKPKYFLKVCDIKGQILTRN